MKKILINGISHSVDQRIAEFTINQKASSNVDFFGTDLINDQLFVQFKNGSSYIYSGVNSDTLMHAHSAESIGKYVVKNVVGLFESEKIPQKLVEKDEESLTEELTDSLKEQCENRINRESQAVDASITDLPEPKF